MRKSSALKKSKSPWKIKKLPSYEDHEHEAARIRTLQGFERNCTKTKNFKSTKIRFYSQCKINEDFEVIIRQALNTINIQHEAISNRSQPFRKFQANRILSVVILMTMNLTSPRNTWNYQETTSFQLSGKKSRKTRNRITTRRNRKWRFHQELLV